MEDIYMKKTTLIIALCASLAAGSASLQAKPDNVKLATALVGTGVTTMVVGQCAKWAYDNGQFRALAKFCLKNPWYPLGASLIATGAALLYKDAINELFSPLTELMQSTKRSA